MVQRPDMAPVNVLGAGEEVVVVGGADSVEGRVDVGLARDECGKRCVVGLWHGVVSRGVVGDNQARGRARSSGECGATRRHPLTRGASVLLTQC